MYIGKNPSVSESGEERTRKPIYIPENYAGNAFSTEIREDANELRPEEPMEKPNARHLPVCVEPKREKNNFFPKLDRLFSSDTLLILLAILLAGSEDGGELAVILLLLLLF